MASTIAVKIVRVDKDTLRLLKYSLHIWPGTHEVMLKQVERGCAVGDFAIVRDGTCTQKLAVLVVRAHPNYKSAVYIGSVDDLSL